MYAHKNLGSGEFLPKAGVQDVERGVLEGINPLPWQTDTSNSDWFYNEHDRFKTASEVIGVDVLPSMLAAFRESHPDVTVDLAVTHRSEDLLRKDADLAIRMTRPTQQALVSRRLGRIELGLFAHRRYLRRHGTPRVFDDLRGHSLSGFDHEPAYVRAMRPKDLPWSREWFALRTDHDLAALSALRAGYGIGFCQVPLAARDPKLVRVLGESLSVPMETWAVMHEDMRRAPAVRHLFDHLAAALIDYAKG